MLEELGKAKEEKSMDEIAEMIYSIIVANGLTMAEVAALNYYIAERTIKAPHNVEFIKEQMGIDVRTLGIEGIFSISQALTKIYVSDIHDSKR